MQISPLLSRSLSPKFERTIRTPPEQSLSSDSSEEKEKDRKSENRENRKIVSHCGIPSPLQSHKRSENENEAHNPSGRFVKS